MKYQLGHEKPRVYQEAIRFVGWCHEIQRGRDGNAGLKDQLNRAATSVALNIAEGNGKSSLRDRSRYFEIARGSTFERAARLYMLSIRQVVK